MKAEIAEKDEQHCLNCVHYSACKMRIDLWHISRNTNLGNNFFKFFGLIASNCKATFKGLENQS
jgi:hypothetical protein